MLFSPMFGVIGVLGDAEEIELVVNHRASKRGVVRAAVEPQPAEVAAPTLTARATNSFARAFDWMMG